MSDKIDIAPEIDALEHKRHSRDFGLIRHAIKSAMIGSGGQDRALLALRDLEEQLETAQRKLDAAATMLAEAEKIVPGVITTAGRMALGMNDRERADALRVERDRLVKAAVQAQDHLRPSHAAFRILGAALFPAKRPT